MKKQAVFTQYYAFPIKILFAKKIAGKTGYTVKIINNTDTAAQGVFNSTKGEIVINIANGNFYATAMHEATHFLELNSPEEYAEFKQMIIDWLYNSGKLESTLKKHAESYNTFTDPNDVTSEVVANAAEALLRSDKFVEEMFMDSDFAEMVCNENKSLAHKFVALLKNIIEGFKKGLKRYALNHSIADDFASDVNRLEKAVEIWTKAFNKHEGTADVKVEEADTTENTADMGGEGKYSIVEDFTDENGNHYKNAVLLDTNFFDGIPVRKWFRKLKEYVENRAENDPFILPITDENGDEQILQFAGKKERVIKNGSQHPVLTKLYRVKEKVEQLSIIHIDEIVEISEEKMPYKTDVNSHGWLDKNGWLHRNANVINARSGEIYNITFDIAKSEDGRTILYAMDGNTKKVGQTQVSSMKIKGSRSYPNSLTNSISQPTPNVNTQNEKNSSNEKKSISGAEIKSKFSLTENVEETDKLIAVHNLDQTKLLKAIGLGGFPMPSIAIVNANSGHSGYGDISLVFDKSTIDPKKSTANKVYGLDVWSPTFPSVEYKSNAKVEKRIYDKYHELSQKYGYEETRALYNFVNDPERKLNNANGEIGLKEELYNNTEFMQLYRLDKGEEKVAKEAIKKSVDEVEYKKWVDELVGGIEEKSGIRNNVDTFTSMGNRRRFEALHYETTLENVVKVMKSQENGAASFAASAGIMSIAAKRYGTISDIKSDAKRLQAIPKEEYSKIKEGFAERFDEIRSALYSKYKNENPFIDSDNKTTNILDALQHSKTKSGVLSYLKQYFTNASEAVVDDLLDLVADISNMPTGYFEAKPKRAVGLNEVAAAIIPDNSSDELKIALKENNISFIEYEHGNEESRKDKLNSMEGVKWSLPEEVEEENKQYRKFTDNMKRQLELTKGETVDEKAVSSIVNKLVKDYNIRIRDHEGTDSDFACPSKPIT